MIIPYNTHKNNCFLYSVNSYLAYYINEKYYKGIHYVWCAPLFNNENNPPSSNPKKIYASLQEDVKGNDKHSAKIQQNKVGLLKGAESMFDTGKITKEEKEDILFIVHEADISDFTPLLYIIDKKLTADKIIKVPLKERANTHSDEFLIKNLHTDEFDVIHI